MCMASNFKITKGGFTLVELLVVMAVLAILTSMLTPALRKSLGVARKLACLGNNQAVGQAVSRYLMDHDSIYPTFNDSITLKNSSIIAWFGRTGTRSSTLHTIQRRYVNPYLGADYANNEVPLAHCPSDELQTIKGSYYYNGSSYFGNQYLSLVRESAVRSPMRCILTSTHGPVVMCIDKMIPDKELHFHDEWFKWNTLFVDGHAANIDFSGALGLKIGEDYVWEIKD